MTVRYVLAQDPAVAAMWVPQTRAAGVEELAALVARQDARIWVDLEAPSPAELGRVADVLRVPPEIVGQLADPDAGSRVRVVEDTIFLAVNLIAGMASSGVTWASLRCLFTAKHLLTVRASSQPAIERLAARVDLDPIVLGRGADHLVHELLDDLVRESEPVVGALAARARVLENDVLKWPGPDPLPRLLQLKAEVAHFDRVIAPEIDVIRELSTRALPVVTPQAALYYRDVAGRLEQVEQQLMRLSGHLSQLLQVHTSVASYRLNASIRVLTIIAAALIPVQVVTGVYGMNFRNMPELGWRVGYPVSLALMIGATAVMLWLLRRRGVV